MSLRCFVQEQRPAQKMDQFVLHNPQTSVQCSVEFMKKLTVVAISSISFLRNVFPISAFSQRSIEGLQVRILKGTNDVPGTNTLINWVKSALGAVQKHYLKKLMLVFQKQNAGITLEVYTFSFTYNRDVIRCSLQGGSPNNELLMESTTLPEDIKKSTQQLLRALLTLTTTLQPLPDDCEVSMNLEFHDDIPDDFDLPEHFIAVDTLSTNFPNDNCYTLKMGKVESRFTTIALSSKSALQCHYENDNQNTNDEEFVVISQNVNEESAINFVDEIPDHLADTQPAVCVVEDVRDKLTTSMSSVNLKGINCICERDDMNSSTLMCASCFTLQHKACYKLFDDQELDRHICVNCHEPDNPSKTCTDPSLVGLNDKAGALYRRALVVCSRLNKVSYKTFITELKYSKQTAQQVFDHLNEDGCFCPSNAAVRSTKTQYILNNVFSMHFNKDYQNEGTSQSTNEIVLLSNKSGDNNRKRNLDPEEVVDLDMPTRKKHIKYATVQRNKIQRVNKR